MLSCLLLVLDFHQKCGILVVSPKGMGAHKVIPKSIHHLVLMSSGKCKVLLTFLWLFQCLLLQYVTKYRF